MGLCDDGKKFLEITTMGSCPIHCSKYCPWDLYKRAYGKPDDQLTVDTFLQVLQNVPRDVVINFAGFCEPLLNPDCMEMIHIAYSWGFKVALSTTLSNAEPYTMLGLNIPFEELTLHLPDCYGNAKIVEGINYWDIVAHFARTQKKLSFSIMNDEFKSCGREHLCRGNPQGHWRGLFHHCIKITVPQWVLVPNGDVYYCCVDFGLTHKIGNLLKQSWEQIAETARPPRHLCNYCKYNRFWPFYIGRQLWLKYQ